MTAFRRLAVASTFATLFLIAVGGLVRATKSGLGCGDDWPDCSGRLVPSLANRAMVIEFSHRLAASIVVVLLGALMVFALRRRSEAPRLVWPSVGAFLLVMSQAVIGMLVVKLHLDAESVILHLGTALALLALLIYISLSASAHEGRLPAPPDAGISKRAKGAAAAVFLLMLVGSYVSGRGAGLVFPDWPLMDGRVIPDLAVEVKAIHFLHRALALIVGGVVLWATLQIVKHKEENPFAARMAHIAGGLFFVEVLIGAANVWTELNAAFVTLHLAIGACIWASLVTLTVATNPKLAEASREAGRGRAPAPLGQGA